MRLPEGMTDPGLCFHRRTRRLGIQRLPYPPYRVYLLNCLVCCDTITTGTLRLVRKAGASSVSA